MSLFNPLDRSSRWTKPSDCCFEGTYPPELTLFMFPSQFLCSLRPNSVFWRLDFIDIFVWPKSSWWDCFLFCFFSYAHHSKAPLALAFILFHIRCHCKSTESPQHLDFYQNFPVSVGYFQVEVAPESQPHAPTAADYQSSVKAANILIRLNIICQRVKSSLQMMKSTLSIYHMFTFLHRKLPPNP